MSNVVMDVITFTENLCMTLFHFGMRHHMIKLFNVKIREILAYK